MGIVRLRTRLLERERTRLEAVVSSRTIELAHKNSELERVDQLEQDEKLAARLAEEKTRLELLRSQLQTRTFSTNSLNSIRALVHANPLQADENGYPARGFLPPNASAEASDELTTVAEEIEMLRTYLDVEKVRWQEALVVRYAVDPPCRSERLPQFLLLPLVENAIKSAGRRPGHVRRRDHHHREADLAHLLCRRRGPLARARTPQPTSGQTHASHLHGHRP